MHHRYHQINLQSSTMESLPMDSFLQVPYVQELAKQPLTTVPDRYIRHNQDPPSITDHTASFPVIDMQELLLSGEVNSQELQKLHSACKDWGFFQVINHGVSLEVVEKMKVEAQSLFKLPLEEKKILGQRKGEIDGFGTTFVMSEEQKLDWVDKFYINTFPLHRRKKHLFTQLPQSFREALEEYSKGVKDLAMKILMSMTKALKMEEREMMELFDEEGNQTTAINYYPPCPQPELVAGISQHSDATGLTILLEVNETDGLQIKKDGMWFPVKTLPHAFVINVGDILEMVTNGIYRSIEHRAVVNSSKERFSIVSFHSPRPDADMGPALSLITPQTPAIFRRTSVIDYLKGLGPLHLRDQYKSYFYI